MYDFFYGIKIFAFLFMRRTTIRSTIIVSTSISRMYRNRKYIIISISLYDKTIECIKLSCTDVSSLIHIISKAIICFTLRTSWLHNNIFHIWTANAYRILTQGNYFRNGWPAKRTPNITTKRFWISKRYAVTRVGKSSSWSIICLREYIRYTYISNTYNDDWYESKEEFFHRRGKKSKKIMIQIVVHNILESIFHQ